MATRVLSIEVGIKSTKVCEVDYDKKSPCVYSTLTFPNPENCVEDGIIRDKETFCTVLQENLGKAGIKNSNVIFTIISNKIATREVIIPYVSEKKIQGIINSSASEYFPMDLSDYTISYRVIEKNHKDDKNIKVLVLAAPVELIRSYYAVARVLKLHIMNLDYIGNSYYHVMAKEVGKGVNIAIHIDELNSIVTIIDNGVLALQRIINFGSQNLVDAVMNEPVLEKETQDSALEYLCNDTVLNYQFTKSVEFEPIAYQNGQTGFSRAKAEQRAKEDVTLVVQELLRNIARILDYYNSKSFGRNIAAIYITGIGSKINGLARLMNNEIGIEVKKVENFYSIHSSKETGHKKENIAEYAACIGGVLYPIGFSLPEIIDNKAKKSNKNSLLIIFSLSLLLSIVLIVISVIQKKSAIQEKNDIQEKIKKAETINELYRQAGEAEKRCNSYTELYKASTSPNEFLHDIISYLETKSPDTIGFASMSEIDNKIMLKGASVDKGAIGQLLMNLEEVPIINLPITATITQEESEEGMTYYSFDLGFTYSVDGTEDKDTALKQNN